MAERFRPRHVVAVVALLCGTYLLAAGPAAAITGTVVNLADRTDAYYAKVDAKGALKVASVDSPASTNYIGGMSSGLGSTRDLMASGTAPTRLAITQLTTSYNTFSATTPKAVFVTYSYYRRTSGSGTCANVEANQTTGFVLLSMRSFMVPALGTVELNFTDRALTTPVATTGQLWCLIAGVVNPGTTYAVYLGLTGYLV